MTELFHDHPALWLPVVVVAYLLILIATRPSKTEPEDKHTSHRPRKPEPAKASLAGQHRGEGRSTRRMVRRYRDGKEPVPIRYREDAA